jgi:KDEL-tailed cysteine endopeptidase
MEESNYPYAAVKKTCNYKSAPGQTYVTSYKNVAKNDPLAHLNAVAAQPVAIGISAGTSIFQFYKSGILDTSACGTNVNHAVLLVGYGKDAKGVLYWIIKNSWATTWGESGYARIKRDTTFGPGICGLL